MGWGRRAGSLGTCSAAFRHSSSNSHDSTLSPAAYLQTHTPHSHAVIPTHDFISNSFQPTLTWSCSENGCDTNAVTVAHEEEQGVPHVELKNCSAILAVKAAKKEAQVPLKSGSRCALNGMAWGHPRRAEIVRDQPGYMSPHNPVWCCTTADSVILPSVEHALQHKHKLLSGCL